jgi:hypothetical protein
LYVGLKKRRKSNAIPFIAIKRMFPTFKRTTLWFCSKKFNATTSTIPKMFVPFVKSVEEISSGKGYVISTAVSVK